MTEPTDSNGMDPNNNQPHPALTVVYTRAYRGGALAHDGTGGPIATRKRLFGDDRRDRRDLEPQPKWRIE